MEFLAIQQAVSTENKYLNVAFNPVLKDPSFNIQVVMTSGT